MKLVSTFLTVLACTGLAMAGDWPQGAGPNGNLSSANEMPVEWSVALDERIHWKIALPETGQNTPTVFENKVFFPPTNSSKPTHATIGKNIIASCCDAKTGEVNGSETSLRSMTFGSRAASATAPPRCREQDGGPDHCAERGEKLPRSHRL